MLHFRPGVHAGFHCLPNHGKCSGRSKMEKLTKSSPIAHKLNIITQQTEKLHRFVWFFIPKKAPINFEKFIVTEKDHQF
jgi:hypothetical protein